MSFMIENLLRKEDKTKVDTASHHPNENYGAEFYRKENFEEEIDDLDEFDEDDLPQTSSVSHHKLQQSTTHHGLSSSYPVTTAAHNYITNAFPPARNPGLVPGVPPGHERPIEHNRCNFSNPELNPVRFTQGKSGHSVDVSTHLFSPAGVQQYSSATAVSFASNASTRSEDAWKNELKTQMTDADVKVSISSNHSLPATFSKVDTITEHSTGALRATTATVNATTHYTASEMHATAHSIQVTPGTTQATVLHQTVPGHMVGSTIATTTYQAVASHVATFTGERNVATSQHTATNPTTATQLSASTAVATTYPVAAAHQATTPNQHPLADPRRVCSVKGSDASNVTAPHQVAAAFATKISSTRSTTMPTAVNHLSAKNTNVEKESGTTTYQRTETTQSTTSQISIVTSRYQGATDEISNVLETTTREQGATTNTTTKSLAEATGARDSFATDATMQVTGVTPETTNVTTPYQTGNLEATTQPGGAAQVNGAPDNNSATPACQDAPTAHSVAANIEPTPHQVVAVTAASAQTIHTATTTSDSPVATITQTTIDPTKAVPESSNLGTPKRTRFNDNTFAEDMYRQSPVANMSSVFATAMTSLYGEPPLDVEPLAHSSLFIPEPPGVPAAVGSPHAGATAPYGAGPHHLPPMMLQQFRASPARSPALSVDSSERSNSPFDDLDTEGQEPSRKKARTTFTSEQLRGLENIFSTQRYLSASDRTAVARKLHLNDFQVKTWFQNRRIKEKKQMGLNISQLRATETSRSSPKLSSTSSGGDTVTSVGNDGKGSKMISTNTPTKRKQEHLAEESMESKQAYGQEEVLLQKAKDNQSQYKNVEEAISGYPSAPAISGSEHQHTQVATMGNDAPYAVRQSEPFREQSNESHYGAAMPLYGIGENGMPIQRGMVPVHRGHMPLDQYPGQNLTNERHMPVPVNHPSRHMLHVAGQIPEELIAMGRGNMPADYARVMAMPDNPGHVPINRLPLNVHMDHGHIPRTMGPLRFSGEHPGSHSLTEEQRMQLFHASNIRPAQARISQFGNIF